MAHFRQSRPAFMPSEEAVIEFAFETVEELLAHPVLVARPQDAGFSHFALHVESGNLFAVYDGGRSWLAVGTVSQLGKLTLPVCAPPAHPVPVAPAQPPDSQGLDAGVVSPEEGSP